MSTEAIKLAEDLGGDLNRIDAKERAINDVIALLSTHEAQVMTTEGWIQLHSAIGRRYKSNEARKPRVRVHT